MTLLDRIAKPENGWGPWLSLIWLSFVVAPWLFGWSQISWTSTVMGKPSLLYTLLAVAVFLPIHFWRYHKTGWQLWLGSAAIFLLPLPLFKLGLSPFAHTFFIYASIPTDESEPRESLTLTGVGTVLSALALYCLRADWPYYLFTCLIIASIGVTAVFHQLQERDRKIIRRQETEITRLAKLAERERIARDLHDLLGHTLSLIALKAELAHRLIPADTARAASEMADVAKVARGALAEVRQAIVGLHAVGLIDALKKAEETLYAAGLKIAVDIAPLPTLAEDLEHAIAQTLTEAVTNIVRHAAAKRVVITLSHAAEGLKLSIADDGRGMGDSTPGNGMTGMRARVTALGGSIAWRNEGGSTVELCVPLAAS